MRNLNDFESQRLEFLRRQGLRVAVFEPTATGLGKGYSDATREVRRILASEGVHDYELQAPGDIDERPMFFITPNSLMPSEAAFYRAHGRGDRRMRFTSLAQYATGGEIVAMFKTAARFFLINISRIDVAGLLGDEQANPLLDAISDSLGLDEMRSDVTTILFGNGLTNTEKLRQIQARLGQAAFREKLLAFWGRKCCVTGYSYAPLLRASHIKPWRSSNDAERLDVHNGLLLVPNLDVAFDGGLITFENNGFVRISNRLRSAGRLGINPLMRARLRPQHLPYMEFHRQQIYRA